MALINVSVIVNSITNEIIKGTKGQHLNSPAHPLQPCKESQSLGTWKEPREYQSNPPILQMGKGPHPCWDWKGLCCFSPSKHWLRKSCLSKMTYLSLSLLDFSTSSSRHPGGFFRSSVSWEKNWTKYTAEAGGYSFIEGRDLVRALLNKQPLETKNKVKPKEQDFFSLSLKVGSKWEPSVLFNTS